MPKIILEKIDVPFHALPDALDGYQILLITDVHAGLIFRLKARAANEIIGNLDPDLIVCAGDTVNCPMGWPRAVSWLTSLPSGVPRYAVPGNWDYGWGGTPELFDEQMLNAGMTPLRNSSVTLKERGCLIRVVGLDDIMLGTFDPDRGFSGQEGEFTLAVCHNPDVILHVDESLFDLLLSGHTHGGQVRIPGVGPVFTSTHIGTPYASGLFELRDSRFLYVSRGLGQGIFPWRVFCPAELTLLTLQKVAKTSMEIL